MTASSGGDAEPAGRVDELLDQQRAIGAVIGAVRAISPPPAGRYLHIDLDVLDLDIARVNVYGAPGGLTAQELGNLVRAVCRESRVRAVSLTACDPGFDPQGRVPPIALDLLRIVGESPGLGS